MSRTVSVIREATIGAGLFTPADHHTAKRVQEESPSPPATAAAPDRTAHPDTLRKTLDGQPDVYAFTVNCIIRGERGWKAARALVAVMITFLLQMGLLILLWEALIKGSSTWASTKSVSQNDRLWVQVGRMQQQVTWLQQHAMINSSAESEASGFTPFCHPDGGTTYNDTQECIGGLVSIASHWLESSALPVFTSGLATMAVEDLFNKTILDKANRHRLEPGDGPGRLSETTWKACESVINILEGGNDDRPALALSVGMLGSVSLAEAHKTGSVSGALPSGLKDTGFTCYYPSLPAPTARDPSPVNLLAFLALAVYVHEEVRKAVWLSYTAAAYSGILPSFYQIPASLVARPDVQLRLWHKLCIAVAPIMQFLTACLVLASSLALTFTDETQTSIVTIILSNVALSFIVDLDNRIGAMLASQDQTAYVESLEASGNILPRVWPHRLGSALHFGLQASLRDESAVRPMSSGSDVVESSTEGSTPDLTLENLGSQYRWQCGIWAKACGHCYMSLVGLLLLLEPLLLSPVTVAYVYYSTLLLAKGNAPRDVAYLSATMAESLAESLHSRGAGMPVFGALASAMVVFLVFACVLPGPREAPMWGPALLAVQAALSVAAQIGTTFALPDFKFKTTGVTLLVLTVIAWLVLFAVWPLLHTLAIQRAQRHGDVSDSKDTVNTGVSNV